MGTTGPEGDPGLLITISTAGKQILAGPRVWKEDRGEGREEVEGGREEKTGSVVSPMDRLFCQEFSRQEYWSGIFPTQGLGRFFTG